MSIPAQSGSGTSWAITQLRGSAWLAVCHLAHSTDVSNLLIAFDLGIKTVHIYGGAIGTGTGGVQVLGFNDNVSAASPQPLHQYSTSGDFGDSSQGIVSELLAGVLEDPRYIQAQGGTGTTDATIAIMMVDKKAK